MRWLSYFSSVPSDFYRVSLALITRVSADIGTGLTSQELSRLSGMSVLVVEDAIKWLRKYPEDKPFLMLTKKETYYTLKLGSLYVDEAMSIPFTFDNTDQKRIAMLEKELLTQRLGTKYTDTSGLAEGISEVEAAIVQEIERTLARGLTITEAYYLSRIISSYGTQRVINTFRGQRRAKEPLRAAYAILTKGGKGKAFGKPEYKPLIVREL